MGSSRLSEQLIQVARARINEDKIRNEANLRRATSDLYYVVFHSLCEALVEPIAFSDPANEAYVKTYTQIYRQVRHNQAEKRCQAVAQGSDFSLEIKRFAKHFVTLKNKRELADYHPLETFSISVVKNDLATTETRLQAFWNADPKERAAFACHVGLKVS